MTLALSYRVIYKRNFQLSMEMSFFVSYPLTGGLSVPRKSGHIWNAGLTSIQHGARCPDLSGPGTALRIGHETKKDISMLLAIASFLGVFAFDTGSKQLSLCVLLDAYLIKVVTFGVINYGDWEILYL
jgi:hypothetical protein